MLKYPGSPPLIDGVAKFAPARAAEPRRQSVALERNGFEPGALWLRVFLQNQAQPFFDQRAQRQAILFGQLLCPRGDIVGNINRCFHTHLKIWLAIQAAVTLGTTTQSN